MTILFWEWDHGREHPVSVRSAVRSLLENLGSEKIGGAAGVMPELTLKTLQRAFSLRKDFPRYRNVLNDGYALEIEYQEENGYGWVRLYRPYGKGERQIGRGLKWTEEIWI